MSSSDLMVPLSDSLLPLHWVLMHRMLLEATARADWSLFLEQQKDVVFFSVQYATMQVYDTAECLQVRLYK